MNTTTLTLTGAALAFFLVKKKSASIGASLKISKQVWDGFTELEKNYILDRYGIDDLNTLKNRIKDARKFFPGYQNIYGKGFIVDANGNTFLWTGNDTRRFHSIGAIYKDIPQNFYPCLDGTYSDHNGNRACTWHGGMITDEAIRLCNDVKMPAGSELNIFDIPVSDIQLYLKKFQNRETPYSIESVQRIVDAANAGTFRFEEFDPVLLWRAPDKNLYMLSGHSRLEAFTRLCKTDNRFCKIPSKIISVSQAEAEEIALRSNTLSTKEKDTERAMFYQQQIAMGKSYGQVLELAKKNEGNNAIRIVSYAYLNPEGKTFTALKALESGEPGSQMIMKSIAQWIGEARMKFPMLTNAHENEIYDWLVNGAYGKQFKKKQDYLAKLATVINNRTEFGVFNAGAVLNLSNAASKSFAEKQLDEMLLEKKMQVQDLTKIISAKIADYRSRGATQQQILELMQRDNALLNRYQLEYIELDKKRSQAIEDGSKQVSMFGIAGMRRRNVYIGNCATLI